MTKRTPIILTNTDHFFYFSSANQGAIGNLVWTKKTFNTAGAVQGLVFDTTTSIFTCRESGLYIVSANIKWTATSGTRGLGFNVNGVRVVTDIRTITVAGASGLEHTVSYPFFFNAGDTLQIDIFHSSGAGIFALAGSEIAVMLLPNE